MAAQIAANSKAAGFAIWLFEVVIENVSPAALADSELPFVNWQMLNGCLASLGSCPDRMMELVRLFAGGLKAPYPPVTRDIQEFWLGVKGEAKDPTGDPTLLKPVGDFWLGVSLLGWESLSSSSASEASEAATEIWC